MFLFIDKNDCVMYFPECENVTFSSRGLCLIIVAVTDSRNQRHYFEQVLPATFMIINVVVIFHECSAPECLIMTPQLNYNCHSSVLVSVMADIHFL
jgi:hypothetical protein